jgi:hypothetical protein
LSGELFVSNERIVITEEVISHLKGAKDAFLGPAGADSLQKWLSTHEKNLISEGIPKEEFFGYLESLMDTVLGDSNYPNPNHRISHVTMFLGYLPRAASLKNR